MMTKPPDMLLCIRAIKLGFIDIPETRLRQLQPAKVSEIAESMVARGQLSPIIVKALGKDAYDDKGRYRLISGHHRLEAAKTIGLETIRCSVLLGIEADKAELIEIDENLCRAELSPAEQAINVGRRKEIYEKLHPETAHGGDRKSAARKSSSQKENLKSFVKETARKTGKGRSTIARHVTRSKKVKVLPDIRGTSLDKGVELNALGELPENKQRELADRAKNGEVVSAIVESSPPQIGASKYSDFDQAFQPIESFCLANLTEVIVQYIEPQTATQLLPRLLFFVDWFENLTQKLTNKSRSSGDADLGIPEFLRREAEAQR